MTNIEFYTTPQGEIEIRSDEGVRTYTRECKEITDWIFAAIESDYPQAYRALCAEYKRSADNPSYFKYLLVHRFMRCNLGVYDHVADIDANGVFHLERIACPLRDRECKLSGVVCSPKFNTDLSDMQLDIMRLFCRNVDCHDIAEQLNTGFDNVRKHIAKAYQRKGVNSKAEFCDWAHKNNIFKTL